MKKLLKCEICGKLINGYKRLSTHILLDHECTSEDYYLKYLGNEVKCPICGDRCRFSNLAEGYKKLCGKKECRSEYIRRYQTGRKQSEDTIKKRIKNTDQFKKEERREKTMIDSYGSLFFVNNPEERSKKISESNKGKKHSKEHHKKIIDSKKKNGTLEHSEETKLKIRESIRKIYDSDNPPITLSSGSPKGYITGKINGLSYRSSYEKKFIEFCLEKEIKIESASTKEFRLQYTDLKGKRRFYYPDFYLRDFNLLIEIKPESLLNNDINQIKFHIALEKYSYEIITEEEIDDLELWFKYF